MIFPSGILSAEPFEPHTLAYLTQARVFPSPLPEAAYNKMLADYDTLQDVTVWQIVYDSGGLKVTGLMVLPTNSSPIRGEVGRGAQYTPSERTGPHPNPPPNGEGTYPVLIYNRGGSREYGKLTLYTVMRTLVPLARAGYLVFASNYRGNAGSEGREEFGGRDVDDVVNLLAVAREHPAFDRKNAFMMGHSRGGMMTALAIKHGAPVNAAISIAGIADARELVHYPKILENVIKPLVPHYHEQPQHTLAERSAVLWPEKITVPLLLLHGDADKDVHVNDSIRLHEELKRLGHASELVVYPTGSHALVRSWDDVLARSLAWMERYKL